MKTVNIYIWHAENCSVNELLGNNAKEETYLTPFTMSETSVDGYYIQKYNDAELGTKNIVFYVSGNLFLTPYTRENEEIIKSCLI